jgi:hypothetical protein
VIAELVGVHTALHKALQIFFRKFGFEELDGGAAADETEEAASTWVVEGCGDGAWGFDVEGDGFGEIFGFVERGIVGLADDGDGAIGAFFLSEVDHMIEDYVGSLLTN